MLADVFAEQFEKRWPHRPAGVNRNSRSRRPFRWVGRMIKWLLAAKILPEPLNEYIDDCRPVRAIDAVVDLLDFATLAPRAFQSDRSRVMRQRRHIDIAAPVPEQENPAPTREQVDRLDAVCASARDWMTAAEVQEGKGKPFEKALLDPVARYSAHDEDGDSAVFGHPTAMRGQDPVEHTRRMASHDHQIGAGVLR